MRKLQSLCTITVPLFILLFLLGLLCLHSSTAYAAESKNQQVITMSTQQYKELMEKLTLQETTLLMLKNKYQILKLPSKTLMERLETAESMLEISRQELTNAKGSLTNALSTIEQLKLSLTELEKAIEQERKKVRLTKAQRNLWFLVAIGCGVYAVTK